MSEGFNIKDWATWGIIRVEDNTAIMPCHICNLKESEHKIISHNSTKCINCGVSKCIIK